MKEKKEFLETFLKELFEKLGVDYTSLNIKPLEEENIIKVSIEGDELGPVIGYRGENISSLQSVLYILMLSTFDESTSLFLDIGGYREEKENRLRDDAHTAAKNVLKTKSPYKFSPMSAQDRRVIHSEISDYADLISYSVGEGRGRRVIVSIKDSKE